MSSLLSKKIVKTYNKKEIENVLKLNENENITYKLSPMGHNECSSKRQ